MYRWMTLAVVVALAAICAKHAGAEGATDLEARFNYLSQHGNVQCSVQFENSIKTMPSDANGVLLLRADGRSPLSTAVGWAQEVF
jgi:hypothetical protein